MPEMRRTIKDSLFSFIFQDPVYLKKLYLSLHPEDEGIREDELKLVTLANIMTTGLYNDLGVLVRDKLILLVEAQSTFSLNLALRMLLYLAATYKDYVEEQKLDLYAPRAVSIPRPELYVVYTGDRKDVPDTLRLSELYDGPGSVEVEVKVLRGETKDRADIVYQYVRFCQISDEKRRTFGPTIDAVAATIRQCIEEGILEPILAARQKEVTDIMVTLYDQEKVMEIHDYNVARAAEQRGIAQGMERGMEKGIAQGMERGIAEGMERGIAQGMERGIAEGMERGIEKGFAQGEESGVRALVHTLQELGIERNVAAEQLERQLGLSAETAEKKLTEYWKA